MKAYVVGYAPEKKEKRGKEEDLYKPIPTLVQYSKGPEWTMGERARADWECRFLDGLGVRVRDHCCAFSVEVLPEGDFAIVCLSHPELVSAPKTA